VAKSLTFLGSKITMSAKFSFSIVPLLSNSSVLAGNPLSFLIASSRVRIPSSRENFPITLIKLPKALGCVLKSYSMYEKELAAEKKENHRSEIFFLKFSSDML